MPSLDDEITQDLDSGDIIDSKKAIDKLQYRGFVSLSYLWSKRTRRIRLVTFEANVIALSGVIFYYVLGIWLRLTFLTAVLVGGAFIFAFVYDWYKVSQRYKKRLGSGLSTRRSVRTGWLPTIGSKPSWASSHTKSKRDAKPSTSRLQRPTDYCAFCGEPMLPSDTVCPRCRQPRS